MTHTSLPPTVRDEDRLAALERYDILDTEPEPAFDRVTQLAAHVFDAPVAIVNFLTADRQWFKSTVGFDVRETGLDVSVCVYTVQKGDVLVVESLADDERFAGNRYLTEHGLRFYAGAPLITPDGERLGTVCVLDTEPRSPEDETLERLSDLAAMVVDELELRRERTEHAQSRELLRQSQRLADVGGAAYDPETDDVIWTDHTYDLFGLSPETEVDLDTAADFYTPESRSIIEPEVERLLDEGGQYDLELDAVTADGERRRVRTIAEAQRHDGETTRIVGAIQDVTEQHRDRRLQEVQGAFFEWIATGAPIDAVLDEIARFTEEELPGAAVSILQLDDDQLYHTSGPSLPEDYIDAIDGVEIGPNVGTCGAAAYHGHEEVTEDIRKDDRWEGYRAAAERAGFRSCNSQVIQGSGGAILGTFAIYRAEPGGLDADERRFVKRMSHVTSVALEREERERALRESEERWQSLVDEHPGPIHVMVDGTFAYANEAVAELLGVEDPEALIGQDLLPFAHPDDRDWIRERTQRLTEDREATPLIEHRIVRADGDERIVLVQSVPITYKGQAAAQAMMWDVTEQRQTEQALRESEERWQRLVDKHPGPIHVTVDGEFVYANEAAADLHGVESAEHLIGRSIHDFIHPAEEHRLENRREIVYEDREEAGLIETRIRRADGTDRTVLVRSVPIQYEGEAAAQTMMRDVTEQREAERELRRSEKKFRTIVENAQPMTFMVDRDGTILLSEGTDLQSFDLEPGETVGESAYDRYADNPGVIGAIERALDGEDVDEEIQVDDLLFDTWYSPFYDEDGEVAGVIGMAADITEKRQAQRELREQKELLQTVFENVPVMIALAEDGEPALINDHVERTLGWSKEDIEGDGCLLEQCYPDPEARQEVLTYIEEAPDEWRDFRPLSKQGEHVDTTWKHVRLPDGRTLGIGVDISDRKERERRLRETNQRLRLALDAAHAGTFEYDVSTGEGQWDERSLNIYGLDEEVLRGELSLIDKFVVDDDREHLREVFFGAIENETHYQVTYRVRRPDGQLRHVSSQGLVLRDEQGTAERVIGINQDVTERKAREQALRDERDRFATLIENLPTPVVHGTTEGGQFIVSTVNPAFEAVFGYDADEVIRKDLHELIVPEDKVDEAAELNRRALEERSVQVEARRLTADGPRDFAVQVAAREQEQGPPETYAIYTDLTRRKEREKQLRMLEAAVEHSQLTVLITKAQPIDEPGPTTVYVNPAFTRVTGYDPDEIIGRSPWLLQGPDTDPEALERIRRALEEDEPVRETVLNYRKDGTPYWNDLFIAPVWNEEDEVTHYVSIQQDVTEQRRRKEVLERQNDLFTKAQDIANVGAWEYDVQSEALSWTEQTSRIHGLSSDTDVTPNTAITFYHPEDQSTIREAFTRAVEAGEPYDLELRLITADDEHRWVHTRGEPQEEDGEIVRVRGTIQDVTERVRRREQLEAAKERAEEADRIKSALLSNMNHEFRTPLTSIISFSELISDNPDVAGQFADRILGGGKRLLYTLNTVMDFAELEAGDRSVTHRRFQLREVVRSVANEFRARARRNGIDLSIDLPDDLSAVTLDQHRVERILTHLVHNAVKFTDDGSVGVCVRKDDSLVELRVEDTGVGIDPDFQDHVFDEFAQQSSGYDRSHEGNGLGLTIVKRLVEEMEGQLDLSSVPGEGTRVTVWVPEGGGGERRPHQ